ncbi:leucine-rich repeats and immunoglobulin-like domains protein 1 [Ciona intestinalis]
MRLFRLVAVGCVLFRFASAQPRCPQGCTCDYYATIHTINCDSQDMRHLPPDIPDWTTHVSFDGNFLTTLPLTGFNTSVYFEEFKFRYNEITKLEISEESLVTKEGRRGGCNHVVTIFPRLKSVNLRGNKIHNLPKCLLFAWPTLKILILDQNRITRVSDLNLASHLSHGASLQELSIMRNQIRRITSDLQTPATSLRGLSYLNLGANIISKIQTGVFMFLPKLRVVKLNDNRLTNIPSYAFVTTGKKLKEIYLQRNGIEILSNLAFAGQPRLQTIDLRSNMITCLNIMFTSCAQPYVHGSTFERRMRQSLATRVGFGVQYSSLRGVRVGGNPWSCDCTLKPLMQNISTNQLVRPSMTSEMCHNPPTMRHYDVITAIEQLLCDEI